MQPAIAYLPDESITDDQDRELRGLLSLCFTKPEDAVFRTQRYFREPYPHRWVIRDERGALVAHVGVHVKEMVAGGRTYRLGGVADVCVHPAHRGQGYVRKILEQVHPWLTARGFDFAVLFGDTHVYGSSGYVNVTNFTHGSTDKPRRVTAMVRALGSTPWPVGDVFVAGPTF